MKKVKSIGAGLIAVAVIALTGTAPLYAQGTTESDTTESPSTQQETSNRGTITAARCTVAEAKVDSRITRVTAATEKTNTMYNTILEKADAFVASASANEYPEVEALETATATAVQNVTALQDATSAYLASLTETKSFACGESEGAFLNALATARADLTEVRASIAATKADTLTNLLPAMKNYLTWLKDTTQE